MISIIGRILLEIPLFVYVIVGIIAIVKIFRSYCYQNIDAGNEKVTYGKIKAGGGAAIIFLYVICCTGMCIYGMFNEFGLRENFVYRWFVLVGFIFSFSPIYDFFELDKYLKTDNEKRMYYLMTVVEFFILVYGCYELYAIEQGTSGLITKQIIQDNVIDFRAIIEKK